MSFRNVYGNDWSENGWRMCNRDECDLIQIPDLYLTETAPLRRGAPLTILGAWLYWYDRNVEEISSSVWGWSEGNDVGDSNHLAGTAVDVNAPKYPWGARVMPADRIAKIREGLRLFEGSVFWGADWDRADEMHYQLAWQEGDARNEKFAKKLLDGYLGIYKQAPAPEGTDTAKILAQAMGNQLSPERYAELLPAVSASLLACDCTNTNRIAMWCAQIGHESLGLYYNEEIASGAAYEGRSDLGNNQPGDGVRFKGRSWIQITGRSNYTRLSQWSFDKGLVPTPTFFVDNPEELSSDEYAGLGAAWYWVVARPDINALSDARDLISVTQRINGGQNGIDDRRTRYQRALGMGDALLTLITAGDDFMAALSPDEQREVLNRLRTLTDEQVGSWSPLRWPGEGNVGTRADRVLAVDANVHVSLVEKLSVEYGDPQSISLLYAVSTTTLPDRQEDAKLARRILAKVPADKIALAGTDIVAYVATLAA